MLNKIKNLLGVFIPILILAGFGFILKTNLRLLTFNLKAFSPAANPSLAPLPCVAPSPSPPPSPSPTAKPLTFAEMNAFYGPCVYAPTLMYHHIEDLDTSNTQGHGY